MDLSVVGIFLSLAVIVILALRGVGIMLIAPLAVAIVAIFSDMGVLDTLIGPYMKGFINYAGKFYLIFLFASVFGKYMDDSGAARAISAKILQATGTESQLYVLLAISAITTLLTLGGVSLFVVIFAIMPIARPLFKQMNIPWHLFPGAVLFRHRLAFDDDDSGHAFGAQHHAHQVSRHDADRSTDPGTGRRRVRGRLLRLVHEASARAEPQTRRDLHGVGRGRRCPPRRSRTRRCRTFGSR